MGCVRRCARFHIGRGQLHERREHRGGRRGGDKIGHVAQAVRFTLGGWRVIDRRKRDEAFAGRELDWLAGRQRRRGIAARVRRRRGLRFRFGQQPLIVPRRIGLALAGSGVRATRQNRQLGAGAVPVFASDPGAGSSAFGVEEEEAEGARGSVLAICVCDGVDVWAGAAGISAVVSCFRLPGWRITTATRTAAESPEAMLARG